MRELEIETCTVDKVNGGREGLTFGMILVSLKFLMCAF